MPQQQDGREGAESGNGAEEHPHLGDRAVGLVPAKVTKRAIVRIHPEDKIELF